MYWYKLLPSVKNFYEKSKLESYRLFLRKTFIEFTFLVFLLGVFYFFVNGFDYYDIRESCYIKIRYDVLRGDRDSIVKALKYIKQNSHLTYYNICTYVDTIYERDCIKTADNDRDLEMIGTDGCYIKGSRAILITPLNEYSNDKTPLRIKTIMTYSKFLQQYWEGGSLKSIYDLENEAVNRVNK